MKKILTVLVALLTMSVLSATAQTAGQKRQLTKQERKAIQQQIDSLQHENAVEAVKDTSFVLEADRVVFKYGYQAYVQTRTNFVMIHNGRATVQVAFNVPMAGPNGMGGVTVEGLISDYKVKTSKNGDEYITFNVMGTAISAQVYITLYDGNSEASVDIMPNFNSNRITLRGKILPYDESFVIQGRTI